MPNIKTAISLDQELFVQIDELASTMKVSRSRVFALAVKDYLCRQENRNLLEQINAAYDDAPDPEEEARLRSARHSFRKIVEEW